MGKQKSKSLEETHSGNVEITSLNENILSEFSIEELEIRYETDPLMLSHIFGLVNDNTETLAAGCDCRKLETCPILECTCKSEYTECRCNGLHEDNGCPVKDLCEFTIKL